ncbi:MAG: hypothetical protein AB8B56_17155 [Crocinitomicaceae bacterium]
MGKLILCIVICFSTLTALYAQDTTRIYLLYTGELFQDNMLKEECNEEYRFKNLSDSVYLELSIFTDLSFMQNNGSCPMYWPTMTIKDGFYEVYIDHFLRETFHTKNNRMLDTERNCYNYSITHRGNERRESRKSDIKNLFHDRNLFDIQVTKTMFYYDIKGSFTTDVDRDYLIIKNIESTKYVLIKSEIARAVFTGLESINVGRRTENLVLGDSLD